MPSKIRMQRLTRIGSSTIKSKNFRTRFKWFLKIKKPWGPKWKPSLVRIKNIMPKYKG